MVLTEIEQVHSNVRHSNAHRMAEIHEILARLERVGLRPIIVKGPAMILNGYYPTGGRMFKDVDLLVAPEEVELVERRLRSQGYAPLAIHERNREAYLAEHHHLPPLFRSIGGGLRLCVEIQWMASGYLAEGDFTRRLSADAIEVESCGQRIRVPHPTNLFVHAILDILSHGLKKGLKSFYDLRQVATSETNPVDWSGVLEILSELKVTSEARFACKLSTELTGWRMPSFPALIGDADATPALIQAAECLVLHKPRVNSNLWKLVARHLLYRKLHATEQHWSEKARRQADPRSMANWLAKGRRVLTTLPNCAELIRHETAELLVDEWLARCKARRDSGANR